MRPILRGLRSSGCDVICRITSCRERESTRLNVLQFCVVPRALNQPKPYYFAQNIVSNSLRAALQPNSQSHYKTLSGIALLVRATSSFSPCRELRVSGQVLGYFVAIDVTRARFSADAWMLSLFVLHFAPLRVPNIFQHKTHSQPRSSTNAGARAVRAHSSICFHRKPGEKESVL